MLGVTLAFGVAAATALQLLAAAEASLAVGPTLLDSAALRASALIVLPIAGLSVAPAVLIGIWAGRLRLLEQPAHYRSVLIRVVLIGFRVATLGAQPVALQAVGLWAPDSVGAGALADAVFAVTGIAGGPGIHGHHRTRGRPPRSATRTGDERVGRRSMTLYIAQSPVWFVATEPSLLDLGGRLGAATAAAVALATWVVTVIIAAVLERRGRRGPAEALLSRLTHGAGRSTTRPAAA